MALLNSLIIPCYDFQGSSGCGVNGINNSELQSVSAGDRGKMERIPCKFLFIRESGGDGFAADCNHRHTVWSLFCVSAGQ